MKRTMLAACVAALALGGASASAGISSAGDPISFGLAPDTADANTPASSVIPDPASCTLGPQAREAAEEIELAGAARRSVRRT